MSSPAYLSSPYFTSHFEEHERQEIERVRQKWGWTEDEFYPRVQSFFANFEFMKKDYLKLALKILCKVLYIREADFVQRINEFKLPLQQILAQTGFSWSEVILAVPEVRGDSADRHAYEVMKSWGLADGQTLSPAQIKKLKKAERKKKILIFFNDTHGTGNQFLTRELCEVPYADFAAAFVVAVTFAEPALKRFEKELPDKVKLLSAFKAPSAEHEFSGAEFRKIKQLGALIYPRNPLGYGDCGLLTAYWFQCPNNSLPIIWADGENNASDGKEIPWRPLHPYRVTKAAPKQKTPSEPPPAVDPKHLSSSCPWPIPEAALEKIKAQIARWELVSASFYETVGRWFGNFKAEEGELALELFLRTRYLHRKKIWDCIEKLRKAVMLDILKVSEDGSSIVLVTTGAEKNSVYDYIGDFIKIWHLEADQICDIKRLKPDKALDKTLVLFYHTRPAGGFFFRGERQGEPSHAERLAKLNPRAIFIAAYAMAPGVVKRFAKEYQKGGPLYLEELSASLAELPSAALQQQLASIEAELLPPGKTHDPGNELLVAYYFQCPDLTSPLIWADQPESEGRRPWKPLFPHRRIPS